MERPARCHEWIDPWVRPLDGLRWRSEMSSAAGIGDILSPVQAPLMRSGRKVRHPPTPRMHALRRKPLHASASRAHPSAVPTHLLLRLPCSSSSLASCVLQSCVSIPIFTQNHRFCAQSPIALSQNLQYSFYILVIQPACPKPIISQKPHSRIAPTLSRTHPVTRRHFSVSPDPTTNQNPATSHP